MHQRASRREHHAKSTQQQRRRRRPSSYRCSEIDSARRKKRAARKRLIAEMRASAARQPYNPETTERRRKNAQIRVLKRKVVKILRCWERNGRDRIDGIRKLLADLGLHFSRRLSEVSNLAMKLFYFGVKCIPVAKYQRLALAH